MQTLEALQVLHSHTRALLTPLCTSVKHGKRENNETAGLFAVNASTGLLGQAKCYKDKLSYEFKCGSTPKKNLAPYKTKIELARKNIDLYKTNRQLVEALQIERKAHEETLSRLNKRNSADNIWPVKFISGSQKDQNSPKPKEHAQQEESRGQQE